VNGRKPALATIPGRVPELVDLPSGCPFAGRCAWVIDACRAAPPPPVRVGPDHDARCLRVGELGPVP
jgi:peptide/nickel transport system ATP-binding protein